MTTSNERKRKTTSKDLPYERQVRRAMIHRERAKGASASEARRIVNPQILAIEARRAELPPPPRLDF